MLLGKGVLAIWNGISAEAESEFVAWHVREHIPERVSLPGFLRGRRFVAIDGTPKYFNYYETESVADLSSPAYLARLNAPTDWTRKVVAHFVDTSRTLCNVSWSLGVGEGSFVEAIAFASKEGSGVSSALQARMTEAYESDPGLTGIHLLQGQTDAAPVATTEARLRSKPDEVAPWVLLAEASNVDALLRFRSEAGAAAVLTGSGVGTILKRGIYQQQFSLRK